MLDFGKNLVRSNFPESLNILLDFGKNLVRSNFPESLNNLLDFGKNLEWSNFIIRESKVVRGKEEPWVLKFYDWKGIIFRGGEEPCLVIS